MAQEHDIHFYQKRLSNDEKTHGIDHYLKNGGKSSMRKCNFHLDYSPLVELREGHPDLGKFRDWITPKNKSFR